jgi:endonuclease YncB( thermonuclease family)
VARLVVLALLVSALGCAPTPAAQVGDADPPRSQPQRVPSAAALVGRSFDGRVVLVADGDTLELVPAGESHPVRVRLEGVDAPEVNEAFGRDATMYTRRLLDQRRVRVEGRDVDSYGRLVARVSVAGRDASRALLEAGLACHFTRFANDPVLAAAERQARSSKQGFWLPTAEKPQCTGLAPRAGPVVRGPAGRAAPPSGSGATVSSEKVSSEKAFRGNVNSRLFHAASCPNANCRNCTRFFSTEAEARAAGFTPAGDCLRR